MKRIAAQRIIKEALQEATEVIYHLKQAEWSVGVVNDPKSKEVTIASLQEALIDTRSIAHILEELVTRESEKLKK